jgi:hypothetical protein
MVFGLFAYLGLNFVLDTFGLGNCLHIVSPDVVYAAVLKKGLYVTRFSTNRGALGVVCILVKLLNYTCDRCYISHLQR